MVEPPLESVAVVADLYEFEMMDACVSDDAVVVPRSFVVVVVVVSLSFDWDSYVSVLVCAVGARMVALVFAVVAFLPLPTGRRSRLLTSRAGRSAAMAV